MGILWMALVQCIPKIMALLAILAGSLLLIGAGIMLLVDNPNGWQNYGPAKYIIGVILIVFGLIFLITMFLYKRRIKLTGVFLDYAGKFLTQRPINFIFIPIFIILLIGLIFLCLFQYLAFSSAAQPVSVSNDIYLQLTRNPILTILTLIEFVWVNFMISGNAAEWYIRGDKASNCYTPVDRYFRKNFGCYPEGSCGICAPICTTFSKCCGCFFDLVRNDAYSYINLTGIPYCNAARNC